jgi:hypothetical protein
MSRQYGAVVSRWRPGRHARQAGAHRTSAVEPPARVVHLSRRWHCQAPLASRDRPSAPPGPHQPPSRLGVARPAARPGHPARIEDLPDRLGALLQRRIETAEVQAAQSADGRGRSPGVPAQRRSGQPPLGRSLHPACRASAIPPNPGASVGIDFGVAHTIALSDGRDFNMPALLSKGERRRLRKLELQAAHRRAARHAGAGKAGTPMSRRERRSYEQIAKLRARQTRRRNDWLHKTTTDLAKSHGLVAVEDIRITNMTRSARGTLQHPGKNVRAKAGLNRSILGMAWGRAVWMLAYKCPDHGGELIKASAAYSSQTCAECGQVAAESRRSRERFCCVACGHAAPADTNAARVLLQRGLAARSGTASGYGVAGRGALAARQAVKRQPTVEAIV